MAVSAYIGIPGSGKSYEVVKSVILPAVASNRRVVSNIYGLNKEKIHQYLLRKNKKLMIEELGEVIYVTNEQCLESDFYHQWTNKIHFAKLGT